MSDRIELGTFMLAAVVTGGDILLRGVKRGNHRSLSEKIERMGVKVIDEANGIRVIGAKERLKSMDVITEPYPGFPTDLQPQIMTALGLAKVLQPYQRLFLRIGSCMLQNLTEWEQILLLKVKKLLLREFPIIKEHQ